MRILAKYCLPINLGTRIAVFSLIVLGSLAFTFSSQAGTIRCASTTSTQNSGLFEYLLPLFEKTSGINVQVVAVGTGAALELGRRGDVDLVLVHARDAELKLLSEGWFTGRHDLMYNDFILVGPTADPAGVKEAASAAAALQKIRDKQALFISRGDDSGTHKKELKLWNAAGIQLDPRKDAWYLAVGQGMGKTIRIASEKMAYTLTDRGTWLSLEDAGRLDLDLVFEGDPELLNQYGVMAVNPERHQNTSFQDTMVFINWLVSAAGQQAIGAFTDSKGNQLFVPNADR